MKNNFITCGKCGSSVEAYAVFCTQCGSKIVPPEPEPQNVNVANDTVACVNCGVINSAKSNFCTNCGSVLVKMPTKKTCPNCNTEHDLSSNFCCICGSPLSLAQAPVFVAPVAPVAPVVQAAPVVQTPTPVVQAAPIVEAPTPVAQAAPIVEAPTPAVQTEPIVETPIPVVQAEPIVEAPAPVVQAEPIVETPAPVAQAPTFTTYSTPFVAPQATAPVKVAKPKKPFNAAILNKGVLFVLAALLFAFSFLPIFKLSFKVEKEEIEMKFSAIDAIIFSIDNLYNLDEDDLADSDLQYQFEDAKKDSSSLEFDDDTEEISKAFNKIYKLEHRLDLRKETTPFLPNVMLAGISALIYMIIAFVCFIMAQVSFLRELAGRKTSAKPVIKLLFFVPFMALITSFTLSGTLSYLANSKVFSMESEMTKGIGGVMVGLITVGALCLVMLIQNIIANRKVFSVARTVFSTIALIVLCVTLVLCSSMEVFTTTVKIQTNMNKDKRTSVDIPIETDIYDFLSRYSDDLDKDLFESISDRDSKKEFISDQILGFSYCKKINDIKKGFADIEANKLVLAILVCWNNDIISAFSLPSIMFTLIFAFLALSIASILLNLCSVKDKASSSVVFTVWSHVLTIAAFVLNYILVLTLQEATAYFSVKNVLRYSVSTKFIAFAILVSVSTIFAIVHAIVNKRTQARK